MKSPSEYYSATTVHTGKISRCHFMSERKIKHAKSFISYSFQLTLIYQNMKNPSEYSDFTVQQRCIQVEFQDSM